MAQIRLEPPGHFNFRTYDDWPRWKRRFEQFRVTSGLTTKDDTKQVNTLLYCIGEEAEDMLSSASITADEQAVYDSVMAKFNGFFRVRRNVIFERARFNQRNQLKGEMSEQYIMELYRLSESCEYGDLKDKMIRDRLVMGIHDAALSQQLQLDADLTLDKMKKNKMRQREAEGEQQQELKRAPERATNLDDVHRRLFRGKSSQMCKNEGRGIRRGKTTPMKLCGRCGRGSHPCDKCPAKDAMCHRCENKGHFSSQCFTKQVANIKIEMEAAFLVTVTHKKASAWYTTVQLNQRRKQFKLETGAEVTAISKKEYENLRKVSLTNPERVLYGPSRQP